MKNSILIDDLHYRPEGFPADQPDLLSGVSLTIESGQFVALIGKNGSGKTSLLELINGLRLPTSGRVIVNGWDTRNPQERARCRALVGMVFQNPADQIVASTVAEDIAFGLENANLPTDIIQTRVAAQLSAAHLEQDADRPPFLLSGGQLQKVALAGVLARQPQILLLDEPTAMLDPLAREAFLAQVKRLHQQGMTIIYITHHMEEATLADQVVALDAGQVVLAGSPQSVFQNEVKLHAIGLEIPEAAYLAKRLHRRGWPISSDILSEDALLEALPPYPVVNRAAPFAAPFTTSPPAERASLIELQDVYYAYQQGTPLVKQALNGITLNLPPGQINALIGANGSGKSTLLQHFNGLLRPSQGRLRVGSFILSDPATRLRDVVREVGLVFQNPEAQFFEVLVGDEIAFGAKQLGLTPLRERVQAAMTAVGLDFETFKDRRLETLSGGEKRKVALASTLVLDQDLLLFDEPTAGMDPHAREEILLLFERLCEEGKTIVIASHRLDELARTASSFTMLTNGTVQLSGDRAQVLFDPVLAQSRSFKPPMAVRVTQRLIALGWPLAGLDLSTPARLMAALPDMDSLQSPTRAGEKPA